MRLSKLKGRKISDRGVCFEMEEIKKQIDEIEEDIILAKSLLEKALRGIEKMKSKLEE